MNVLVVDVGGTHVKALASDQAEPHQFESGPTLLPKELVLRIQKSVDGWKYDVMSVGYPGPVLRNRPVAEPHNLGRGWVGFDFEAAFGYPVKLINDAAMQALGSYKGGKMLFLGLRTSLGSAMIVDGIIESMELGHQNRAVLHVALRAPRGTSIVVDGYDIVPDVHGVFQKMTDFCDALIRRYRKYKEAA